MLYYSLYTETEWIEHKLLIELNTDLLTNFFNWNLIHRKRDSRIVVGSTILNSLLTFGDEEDIVENVYFSDSY